jgi:endonuclease/exonuclease/phosphatase family metal-dependent hydrolase
MVATCCLASLISWWWRQVKCVTLRLLSYNIRFGGRGREHALAETIIAAAPDLVVFQEATDPAVIERLAEDDEVSLLGRAAQSLDRFFEQTGG